MQAAQVHKQMQLNTPIPLPICPPFGQTPSTTCCTVVSCMKFYGTATLCPGCARKVFILWHTISGTKKHNAVNCQMISNESNDWWGIPIPDHVSTFTDHLWSNAWHTANDLPCTALELSSQAWAPGGSPRNEPEAISTLQLTKNQELSLWLI